MSQYHVFLPLDPQQPMYKINLIIMLGLREDAHHMLKDKFIAAVEERLMSFDNVCTYMITVSSYLK